eukprot:gene29479-38582_t
MQQTITTKYDSCRRVKTTGLFGCSASTIQQRDISRLTSNSVKDCLRNPEILKVEQIFSKVNEAFLQRQHLSKALVNEIHENEIQLQFLEHQIRDQFDLNAKQSAALSMTTHGIVEVGATVSDFRTVDATILRKSFDYFQDQANQTLSIADTLLEDISVLSSMECALAENLPSIKSQIQIIDAKILEEHETANALNEALVDVAAEIKDLNFKLADTGEKLSASEKRFALACKGKKEYADLETLRYSISTEQRSISQLEIESERILSTSNADAEKIFEMVQDIQEKITHNERILTQVSSSSEDYTVEVSQLQRLLIAINDHIDRHICQCLGESIRSEDLRLKRSDLQQKVVIVNAETASLEELLRFCVREKNDAETNAMQTAEENEQNYSKTCSLMRELKDLNEASPKLVQQSFKAEEDLKSKLIEMDTKELTLSEKTRDATAKLNVQRLSLESLACQLKYNQDLLSANRASLQEDRAIVESLQLCIRDCELTQAQFENDIEKLNEKTILLDSSTLQLSKLNDLLERKRMDLAVLVKDTASERSKLFSLRNDAPLSMEKELPEDVATAMNAEIQKEWTAVAEEMNKAHNNEVYEMNFMLQQLNAGFPTTDGSEQLEDISRLNAELERIQSRLPLLRNAVVEADERKQRRLLEHAERRSISHNAMIAESSQRKKSEFFQHSLQEKEDLVTTLDYDDNLAPFGHDSQVIVQGTAAEVDPSHILSGHVDRNASTQKESNVQEKFGKASGGAVAVVRKKATVQVHLPLFSHSALDDDMDNASHFSLFADKPSSPPEMNSGKTPHSSNRDVQFKRVRLSADDKHRSSQEYSAARVPVQSTQSRSVPSESCRQESFLDSRRSTQKADIGRVSAAALPKAVVPSRKFPFAGNRAVAAVVEKKPAVTLQGQSSPGDWFNVDDSF